MKCIEMKDLFVLFLHYYLTFSISSRNENCFSCSGSFIVMILSNYHYDIVIELIHSSILMNSNFTLAKSTMSTLV